MSRNDLTTRRKFLRRFAGMFLATPALTVMRRRQSTSIPRIGFLIGVGYPQMVAAFQEELAKLGYSEGKNIVIEKRFSRSNTDDIASLTEELVKMNLALIVAAALPFALVVRKQNPAMPMVIATCPGMISNGFAQSFERPGGMYTGLDELPPGVTSKRIHLLKTAAPSVSRIALLSTTPGQGGHEIQLAEAQDTAAELGVQVKAYRATSLAEVERALENIAKDEMNGMLSFQGGLSLTNRQLIVDFAAQNRIPAIYQATLFAEAGGLMSWAPDLVQQFREAAHYTEQILKGARPGDLPIKHPTNYQLTLNQTAAKRIGITFSPELVAQAKTVLP